MSFRDIGVILKKVVEEKQEKEGTKQDDNSGENQKNNSYLYLPRHTNSFPKVRLH